MAGRCVLVVEVGVFVQKDFCGEYIVGDSVQLSWCFSVCVVLSAFYISINSLDF